MYCYSLVLFVLVLKDKQFPVSCEVKDAKIEFTAFYVYPKTLDGSIWMILKRLLYALALSPSLVVDSIVLSIYVKNRSHELVERPVEQRLGSFSSNMYSNITDNTMKQFRLQDDKVHSLP